MGGNLHHQRSKCQMDSNSGGRSGRAQSETEAARWHGIALGDGVPGEEQRPSRHRRRRPSEDDGEVSRRHRNQRGPRPVQYPSATRQRPLVFPTFTFQPPLRLAPTPVQAIAPRSFRAFTSLYIHTYFTSTCNKNRPWAPTTTLLPPPTSSPSPAMCCRRVSLGMDAALPAVTSPSS